jgi:putative NIF3 family GTP cyclohydrolase 1 type 2
MAELQEIVNFLDRELKTTEIRDYPGALNGLQLENDGTVKRVISAVDASLAVIQEAAKEGGLLLVHHGMFWQGAQKITGPYFHKLKAAIHGNLAIYSSHLPLDFHPEIGNNILLARAIGLQSIQPILPKDGFATAVVGEWDGSRNALATAIVTAVGRPLQCCDCGIRSPRKVAVMTGGAGSEVSKIAELGIDSFVTGEGPSRQRREK